MQARIYRVVGAVFVASGLNCLAQNVYKLEAGSILVQGTNQLSNGVMVLGTAGATSPPEVAHTTSVAPGNFEPWLGLAIVVLISGLVVLTIRSRRTNRNNGHHNC